MADPFGYLQNQKPGDLAYMTPGGVWAPLRLPTTTPAVLCYGVTVGFEGGVPVRPAWETVNSLLSAGTTGNHALLGSASHGDTVTQSVSRGSLIYGNSTPAWDELVIGGSQKVLKSDGTDVSWDYIDNLSISDRTRSVWCPATNNCIAVLGTPDWNYRGSTANYYEKYQAWAFDGAADEAVLFPTVELPTGWTGSAITPTIVWAGSNNSVGNVVWQILGKATAAGEQEDQGVEFTPQITVGVSGTQDQRQDSATATFTPGTSHFTFVVLRAGSAGTDTYDGSDAWLIGVRFDITMDM